MDSTVTRVKIPTGGKKWKGERNDYQTAEVERLS